MSGILALFERDAGEFDHDIFPDLMAAGVGRAVDGSDSWLRGPIGLGHHHFWVTPEEQSEIQPLVLADGQLAITADVRLDNRADLINALDLEEKWAAGQSDSMLILLAYQCWSVECVKHLAGDFAFAIWDGNEKQLFLARDPLGVRQLYYTLNDRFLLAATIVDVLLAHPAVEKRVNPRRVADYLALQMDYDKETFFEGIYYLPPAHCLLVSETDSREWRYWSIDPYSRLRYKDSREYADHLLLLLRQAVKNRLRCSGRVGVSLSGGLDSTSVTAVAVTEPGHPAADSGQLRSYSYIFKELATCDESSYIASVVERYGLQQTNVIGDDCWPLRDLAEWPVSADPVSFDAYWWLIIKLMQAAQADDIRVMLTGHFGDWLFGGSVYWAADMLRDLRVRELWSILQASDLKNKRQYLINNGLRQFIPPAMRSRYRTLRPRDQLARHPSVHPNLAIQTDLPDRLTGRHPYPGFNVPGMWNRYRDLTFGIVPPTMADLATMWNRHGIELLEPMRDLKLIEFVYSIPADQLGLPGLGKSKRVLRTAMEGLLPDAVRRRRTITSFKELYLLGLIDKERHTVERILEKPQIVSREFVDPGWLADTLPGGCTFTDEGFSLWRCVTLELWLNRYQPK